MFSRNNSVAVRIVLVLVIIFLQFSLSACDNEVEGQFDPVEATATPTPEASSE